MGFEDDMELARELARRVEAEGGRAFYVGGFVRDALSGRENKDIDIEIHGLAPAALESILDCLGERMTIGESFGIYALKGHSLDIAMPRREKLCGRGHRDFEISVDPFIGPDKAAQRRDFTINALMQDVLTGEILDFCSGREDLKKGLIRHVNDESFKEDPLRVLRGAQFAARFGFSVAEETVKMCRKMQLQSLPKERIKAEVEKALLKADKPSIFFETLREMEQLSLWFPELEALIGVKQSPVHHPEGDVWTHTMLVLDKAAKFRGSLRSPLAFMLAALTHDMGKALCTQETDGVIHAYGHEKLGLPLAERFVKRLTDENELLSLVLNLTELHMQPNIRAAAGASIKSTNKMFDSAIDPEALIALAVCDSMQGSASNEAFLRKRLEIYREYMARPYVMGRDLIDAGLKPCAEFADYLAYAHKLRLAGIDKAAALKQTLSYARKAIKQKTKAD